MERLYLSRPETKGVRPEPPVRQQHCEWPNRDSADRCAAVFETSHPLEKYCKVHKAAAKKRTLAKFARRHPERVRA